MFCKRRAKVEFKFSTIILGKTLQMFLLNIFFKPEEKCPLCQLSQLFHTKIIKRKKHFLQMHGRIQGYKLNCIFSHLRSISDILNRQSLLNSPLSLGTQILNPIFHIGKHSFLSFIPTVITTNISCQHIKREHLKYILIILSLAVEDNCIILQYLNVYYGKTVFICNIKVI